jgi:hypothetical protein
MRTRELLVISAAFVAFATACATADDNLPPLELLGADGGNAPPVQNPGGGTGLGGSTSASGGTDFGSGGSSASGGVTGLGGSSLGGEFGSGGTSSGGSGGLGAGGAGTGGSNCLFGIFCSTGGTTASGGTSASGGTTASGGGTGTDPTLKAQCAQKICIDPVFDCLLEGCGITAVCTGFVCVVP